MKLRTAYLSQWISNLTAEFVGLVVALDRAVAADRFAQALAVGALKLFTGAPGRRVAC